VKLEKVQPSGPNVSLGLTANVYDFRNSILLSSFLWSLFDFWGFESFLGFEIFFFLPLLLFLTFVGVPVSAHPVPFSHVDRKVVVDFIPGSVHAVIHAVEVSHVLDDLTRCEWGFEVDVRKEKRKEKREKEDDLSRCSREAPRARARGCWGC